MAKGSWTTLFGARVKGGSVFYKWLVKNFGKKRKPKPKPAPKPVVHKVYMFDDVNVSLIPADADAVAGYIGGRWPTYPVLVKKFPKAKKLSIAVSSIYDADCLDVEPGDAQPAQAAEWIRRQHKRGKALPVVYTSVSGGQHLVNVLDASGLRYGVDYLYWSAHYDPSKGAHVCSPKCGFGFLHTAHGTQYTDKALGRSLDESLVSPKFFG